MNRLTSMCYPQYAPDKNAMITTDDTEENSSTAEKTLGQIRMKPPLVRFRMGDLYGGGGVDKHMMLGFIKSINYTIPDEATWEVDTDFKRPNKLSDNHTGLLDVIIYVLDEYKKRNYFFVL